MMTINTLLLLKDSGFISSTASLVEDILEDLPFGLVITKYQDFYRVSYRKTAFEAKLLGEALALMWLWKNKD